MTDARKAMDRRIVSIGLAFNAPDKTMKRLLVMADGFVDGAMEEAEKLGKPVTEEEACAQAVEVVAKVFREELPGHIVGDAQHRGNR